MLGWPGQSMTSPANGFGSDRLFVSGSRRIGFAPQCPARRKISHKRHINSSEERMSAKKRFPVLAILVMGSMIVSACRAPATPRVVEKVVTQVVRETQVVEKVVTQVVRQTQVVTQVVAAEDYSVPDPILSDVRVRRAIALCTNREEAIKAVYPFETDQKALLMDSFL